MPIVYPEFFRDKDLTLQVRLDTCVDDVYVDFTGKQSYTFGMFKENIGFGITDITIDVNPSLQPIVEITFKDLYGNTIFGTQRVGGSLTSDDGTTNRSTGTDYSVIYNWPPPKFYFTFKGYLGNPVTWILNMKKVVTSFDSSDSSYGLKVSFVPNQWGFFADIPFLYLLAVKGLKRKNVLNTDGQQDNKIESIYDYIKTGKRIDVKRVENTKEFDFLQKQVSEVQANIISSINSSKVITDKSTVKGEVNNQIINDFKAFVVVLPTWLTPEKIKVLTTDSQTLQKLNKFLTLFCLTFGNDSTSEVTPSNNANADIISENRFQNFNPDDIGATAQINQKLDKLKQNLSLIDQAIQEKFFETSKSELSKLTISEILKRIAGDSAYVLGKILQAGIDGYSNNSEIRKSSDIDKKIIGSSFPLMINKDGEEVPATANNLGGQDIGVDKYEMQVVTDFITAISEGIAESEAFDEDPSSDSNNSKLKVRVSNLEMLQQNPYTSDYTTIASNLLMRSAIIGWFTRSNDTNLPGDYTSLISDNDSESNINELAKKDIDNNLSNFMLSGLGDSDLNSLKRFCNFFSNVFDSSGDFNENAAGTADNEIQSTPGLQSNRSSPISDAIKSFKVRASVDNKELVTVGDFFDKTILTVIGQTNPEIILPKSGGTTGNSYFKTYGVASRFYHNGINYMFDQDITEDNTFYMLLFRDQDAIDVLSVNSAPTDSEFAALTPAEKDDTDIVLKNTPLGVISIDRLQEGGEDLGRITILQDYIKKGLVYDYTALKTDPFKANNVTANNLNDFPTYERSLSEFLVPTTTTLVDENASATDTDLPARNLAYTIFTHTLDTTLPVNDGIAWGLFLDISAGKNQRIAIKTMADAILSKITNFETKKSQAIGNIISKAGEESNSIYKQFHNIFQQWNLLAYDDIPEYQTNGKNNFCSLNRLTSDLARELEEKYTGSHKRLEESDTVETNRNVTFRYDYPFNSINSKGVNSVDVENSVIDIGALYKPDANTTVLNMIQQITSNNKFMFIPIPGNGDYRDIREIYRPEPTNTKLNIRNYFHVLFLPSPESRVYGNNNATQKVKRTDFGISAIGVRYGSVENQVFSKLNVALEDNKPTAESIVNLQRLVSNENKNKTVTKDCSTLPVLEGRSFTATIDMLGNAQIYPMQYFYIENSPIFAGLYQVMKVKHSISPNNMVTSMEGIRLSFTEDGGYGGIPPITIGTLSKISVLSQSNVPAGSTSGPNSNNTYIPTTQPSFLPANNPLSPPGVKVDFVKLRASGQKFNRTPNSIWHPVVDEMQKSGIDTINKIAHFLSQVMHESGDFRATRENLNYDVAGLRATFPRAFPNDTIAIQYERQPVKIGSRAYSNTFKPDLGNGNEASGEGYKFRGGGYIQITGKDAYQRLSRDFSINLTANPDLISQPTNAIKSAVWFFVSFKKKPFSFFETATVAQVTKIVNGGNNGLVDRQIRFNDITKTLQSL